MSSLSFSTTVPARRQSRFSLRTVSGLLTVAMRAWRIRKASQAMQGLSDELLHDIGVSRGEIDQVTRYGRAPRP